MDPITECGLDTNFSIQTGIALHHRSSFLRKTEENAVDKRLYLFVRTFVAGDGAMPTEAAEEDGEDGGGLYAVPHVHVHRASGAVRTLHGVVNVLRL